MSNNCNSFNEIEDAICVLKRNVFSPLTIDERVLPKADEETIKRCAWSNNTHPEEMTHVISHPYEFAKPHDTLCTDWNSEYYKSFSTPEEINFPIIHHVEEVIPMMEDQTPEYYDLDMKSEYNEQNNYPVAISTESDASYENEFSSNLDNQLMSFQYNDFEDVKCDFNEIPLILEEKNTLYVLERNNYQNYTNNSNGFNDSRSSSATKSDNGKPVKRTRTTKAERNRMSELEKKLKKQEDNRKNTARHTERRNEKKQTLETKKRELKFNEDQLKATIHYKEERLNVTSGVIRTEMECQSQIEEIMQFYDFNKSKIIVIHGETLKKDETYNSLKTALKTAEMEYEPYIDHGNRNNANPVCTNTYGSRKSRAKAKKEMCELELEVAAIQREISKYENLLTLVEQFQSNVVALFGHVYSGLSGDEKKYWQRSIIAYQLGEFQGFIS